MLLLISAFVIRGQKKSATRNSANGVTSLAKPPLTPTHLSAFLPKPLRDGLAFRKRVVT
jgi:hypothetical protein